MKALIVDDDRVLADVLAFTLRREGFAVVQAFDGQAALAAWREHRPDLIVLDVNLPQVDGFTVCQQIRQAADTPILMLTVRDEEDDIVRGLQLGADDYISKPFSPRQLVARIQAILRRTGKTVRPAGRQVGSLVLDPGRREMRLGQGEAIALTPLETRLLDYLILNAGHVLTAEAIIAHIWGAAGGDRDMLRQLVHRLRGKLSLAQQEIGNGPRIETISGLGYGLMVDSE